LTKIRNCKSCLTESFHAAVKVLGVSEWKDAAAAFYREIGIDLERLFPGLTALLRAAEVAVT
jgi:hypothetical protein